MLTCPGRAQSGEEPAEQTPQGLHAPKGRPLTDKLLFQQQAAAAAANTAKQQHHLVSSESLGWARSLSQGSVACGKRRLVFLLPFRRLLKQAVKDFD